jgi:hypothetical protein
MDPTREANEGQDNLDCRILDDSGSWYDPGSNTVIATSRGEVDRIVDRHVLS